MLLPHLFSLLFSMKFVMKNHLSTLWGIQHHKGYWYLFLTCSRKQFYKFCFSSFASFSNSCQQNTSLTYKVTTIPIILIYPFKNLKPRFKYGWKNKYSDANANMVRHIGQMMKLSRKDKFGDWNDHFDRWGMKMSFSKSLEDVNDYSAKKKYQ